MRRSTPTHPTSSSFSRRRFLTVSAVSLGGAMVRTAGGYAMPVQQRGAAARIAVTDLGGGLFVFQGAGCNVVAMRGEEGALMIDGGLAANADALLRTVKERTSNNRIHTLINTHWHPEQTGANEAVGREGGVIFAHEKTKLYLSNTVTSALFEGRLAPLPEIARPKKTTRGDGSMDFGGRRIDYGYMPAAHTDGDLYIHFPQMNVLAAGNVVGERWPLLDFRNGAWYGGRVRAVQKLATLVRPDTRVVPADGRLLTGKDVLYQNDIYQKLFKEMIAFMNMGLGAEDVVARNPLKQYQAEFGDPSAFLNGAYRSMQIAYVPD
jgi:glyoxylase-like metal-dependent hydrolase (beta-lactamase superfamily II)